MQLRDSLLSGAYDWIIFPAALIFIVFIGLIASGLWDLGRTNDPVREKVLACEQAAMSKGSREQLADCQIETVVARPPSKMPAP